MSILERKSIQKSTTKEIMEIIFPNGKSDIDDGAKELLVILILLIPFEEARQIFAKSMTIAYLSNPFHIEDLTKHLQNYCIDKFSQDQLEEFYTYLLARKAALMMGKSKVYRNDAGDYYW